MAAIEGCEPPVGMVRLSAKLTPKIKKKITEQNERIILQNQKNQMIDESDAGPFIAYR